MKRKLALVLFVCALFTTICSTFCSCDPTATVGNIDATKAIHYTDTNGIGYTILPDGTLEVADAGDKKKIEIPSEYEGRTVTSIGKNAFRMSSVEKVVLPDTITNISEYSFSFASKLKEVNIPEGITEIATNTFTGCTSLTFLQLPESLEKICMFAFDGSGIDSVVIPLNTTTIEAYAFAECPYLVDVIFEGNTIQIENTAFEESDKVIIYAEKDSDPINYAKSNNIESVIVEAD